ncbi:hypothetical protein [Streptomyces sp. NPDC055709]
MKLRNPFRKTTPAPLVVSAVPEDLAWALEELAGTFAFYGTAEAGESFTCTEADSIARVLFASGNRDEAITWLIGHSHGDELDDNHYVVDEDDPEDEGRVMTDDEIAAYVDLLV